MEPSAQDATRKTRVSLAAAVRVSVTFMRHFLPSWIYGSGFPLTPPDDVALREGVEFLNSQGFIFLLQHF